MSEAKGVRRSSRKRSELVVLVKEAFLSGERVREFCARHGVSEHSFYKWRRFLEIKEGAGQKGLFVPVRVTAETEIPPSPITARFFVQGAGGLRLEFPEGCTAAELALVAGILSC